jgi:hypothetical protein
MRMDSACGSGIDGGEAVMQCLDSPGLGVCLQCRPDMRIGPRAGEEAVRQGPKVQATTADDEWSLATGRDRVDAPPGELGKMRGINGDIRGGAVDEMMRDYPPLGGIRFRGADV